MERILLSDEYKVSRNELETNWSVEDLFRANYFLDQLETAKQPRE